VPGPARVAERFVGVRAFGSIAEALHADGLVSARAKSVGLHHRPYEI